jgi:tRNA uridine 5-carbamoylmethylation protein Kti12
MRELILVRGLPGSGKSTVGKQMAASSTFARHLETDMFWGPDYAFDISRIKEAHEWCQNKTREKLRQGFSIVVSNTFTTAFELLPYFDIAKEFYLKPQVILCQGQFGNVHNVPVEVLEKMAARFEYNIDHLWGRLV